MSIRYNRLRKSVPRTPWHGVSQKSKTVPPSWRRRIPGLEQSNRVNFGIMTLLIALTQSYEALRLKVHFDFGLVRSLWVNHKSFNLILTMKWMIKYELKRLRIYFFDFQRLSYVWSVQVLEQGRKWPKTLNGWYKVVLQRPGVMIQCHCPANSLEQIFLVLPRRVWSLVVKVHSNRFVRTKIIKIIPELDFSVHQKK